STIEKEPIVMDSIVSAARNLCWRRTESAMLTYSSHIGRALHLDFVGLGRGRLHEDLLPLRDAFQDLDLAVVPLARLDVHLARDDLLAAAIDHEDPALLGADGAPELLGLLGDDGLDGQRQDGWLAVDADLHVGGHAGLDLGGVLAIERGLDGESLDVLA